MFRKRVWIPLFILLIVVVGCGLFYSRRAADQEPIKVYKSTPSESAEAHPAEGHFHADGTYHPPSNPETGDTAKVEALPAEAPDKGSGFVNPTSTSTNPMFPDGVVPEHLQCPPELIGLYMTEVDSEVALSLLTPIIRNLFLKYYPSRPLREIWPAFIEAEKWHYANADPERSVVAWGAGRYDWEHQLMLDFPELFVLELEDPWRFSTMRHVELGHCPPDYNLVTLPDGSGRTFRTDDDKRYEFTWSVHEKTESHTMREKNTWTTGGNSDGELIRINLDEITDEELEKLSGWNYNINPYTTGAYKLRAKHKGNL